MRTPSWRATALFLATVTGSSGCSFFRSSTQPVTIMASDPDAEIYANGRAVGRGTVTVELRRDRDQAIMARTDDNRPASGAIKSRLGSGGLTGRVGGPTNIV